MKIKSVLKEKNTKDLLIHTQEECGITLIALVVTIIILIILAGVSIIMLTGQNGVLNRAREAAIQTDIVGTKEQIQMRLMEKYAQEEQYTDTDIMEIAEEITGNDVNEETKTVLSAKGNIVDLSDLFRKTVRIKLIAGSYMDVQEGVVLGEYVLEEGATWKDFVAGRKIIEIISIDSAPSI